MVACHLETTPVNRAVVVVVVVAGLSTNVCLSVFLVLITARLNLVFCGTYPKLKKGGTSSLKKKGVHTIRPFACYQKAVNSRADTILKFQGRNPQDSSNAMKNG